MKQETKLEISGENLLHSDVKKIANLTTTMRTAASFGECEVLCLLSLSKTTSKPMASDLK